MLVVEQGAGLFDRGQRSAAGIANAAEKEHEHVTAGDLSNE